MVFPRFTDPFAFDPTNINPEDIGEGLSVTTQVPRLSTAPADLMGTPPLTAELVGEVIRGLSERQFRIPGFGEITDITFFDPGQALEFLDVTLPEGFTLKLIPGEARGSFSISQIDPQGWELTQDDLFISPEGQTFTRAEIEAFGLEEPQVPTGMLPPPVEPIDVQNILQELLAQQKELQRQLEAGLTAGIPRAELQGVIDELAAIQQAIGTESLGLGVARTQLDTEVTNLITDWRSRFANPGEFFKVAEEIQVIFPEITDEETRALLGRLPKDARDLIETIWPEDFRAVIAGFDFGGDEKDMFFTALNEMGQTPETEALLELIYPGITNEQKVWAFGRTTATRVVENRAEERLGVTKGFWGDLGDIFVAGTGDLVGGIGSALKWLGVDGVGQTLFDSGQFMQVYTAPDEFGEFKWEQVFNPKWAITRLTRMAPMLMALAVPAVGAYGVAGTVAARFGLGAWSRAILTGIGGAALSRPIESAIEAGSAYDAAINKGLSEIEARQAADKVFWNNMILIGADIPQIALAFAPVKAGVYASLLARGLVTTAKVGGKLVFTGLTEGGEEILQDIFIRQALGEEIVWDAQMQEVFALGAMAGIGMGAGGHVISMISNKVIPQLTPEQKIEFDNFKAEFIKQGLSEEAATSRAMDSLEATPELTKIIEKATEEVNQEITLGQMRPLTEADKVVVEQLQEKLDIESVVLTPPVQQAPPIAEGTLYQADIRLDEETKAGEAVQQSLFTDEAIEAAKNRLLGMRDGQVIEDTQGREWIYSIEDGTFTTRNRKGIVGATTTKGLNLVARSKNVSIETITADVASLEKRLAREKKSLKAFQKAQAEATSASMKVRHQENIDEFELRIRVLEKALATDNAPIGAETAIIGALPEGWRVEVNPEFFAGMEASKEAAAVGADKIIYVRNEATLKDANVINHEVAHAKTVDLSASKSDEFFNAYIRAKQVGGERIKPAIGVSETFANDYQKWVRDPPQVSKEVRTLFTKQFPEVVAPIAEALTPEIAISAFNKIKDAAAGREALSKAEVESVRQYIVAHGEMEHKWLGIAEIIWTGDLEIILGVFKGEQSRIVGGDFFVYNVNNNTFGAHSTVPPLTERSIHPVTGRTAKGTLTAKEFESGVKDWLEGKVQFPTNQVLLTGEAPVAEEITPEDIEITEPREGGESLGAMRWDEFHRDPSESEQAIREQLVDFIQQNVPLNLQRKFLDDVAEAKTFADLDKAINRANRLTDASRAKGFRNWKESQTGRKQPPGFKTINANDALETERAVIEEAVSRNPELKKIRDELNVRSGTTEVTFDGKPIKIGRGNELRSMRYYVLNLQKKLDAPLYDIWQRINMAHLTIRAKQQILIDKLDNSVPNFREITDDEKALKRIEDYIAAKNEMGDVKSPTDITANEILLANELERQFESFRNDVRFAKFSDSYNRHNGNAERIQEDIPSATLNEIQEAVSAYENKGTDALREYLDTQEWGVIKSGYDPRSIVKPKLFFHEPRITTFAKGHIRTRTNVDYASEDRNIIQRYRSYTKQMMGLTDIEPLVGSFNQVFTEAATKLENVKQVSNVLSKGINEMKGYREDGGLIVHLVERLYAQVASAVFWRPDLALRNKFQNYAFNPDYHIGLFLRPDNKFMSEERRNWFETFVSQQKGIEQDYLLYSQQPIKGFGRLVKLAHKTSLYPWSDKSNRAEAFFVRMNRIDRALRQYRKDGNVQKLIDNSGLNEFEPRQQAEALELLARDVVDYRIEGMPTVSGEEAFARYNGQQLVNNVHFLYDRAQRAPAEQGATGKTLGNILVFSRSWAERMLLQGNKINDPKVSAREKILAMRIIVGIVVAGMLAGMLYKRLTGKRGNPYNPLNILTWTPGGLIIGVTEDISNVIYLMIEAAQGNEYALSQLPSAISNTLDLTLPFYKNLVQTLDSLTGMANIDVIAMRKIRAMLDESYKVAGGSGKIDRTLLEALQHALLAGKDDPPTTAEKIADAEKKLGTTIDDEDDPFSIGEPDIYSIRDLNTAFGNALRNIDEGTQLTALANAWLEKEAVEDEYNIHPDIRLIDIDPNLLDELYNQWRDVKDLDNWERDYPNANRGNITLRQLELLKEYHTLTTEAEQTAFLEEHPELKQDPQVEWLRSHPVKNAHLALWGQAKILSREAFEELQKMVVVLDIPDSALLDVGLPPNHLVDTYYDWLDLDVSASSREGKLFRLNNPEFNEWYEDVNGLTPIDPSTRRVLEVQDEFKDEFALRENYAIPGSPDFIADPEARNAAYDKLFADNPDFEKAWYTLNFYGAQADRPLLTDEHLDTYITYYTQDDLQGAGYNNELFLMANWNFTMAMNWSGGAFESPDGSKWQSVPTQAVYDLWLRYDALRKPDGTADAAARRAFKEAHPTLWAWKDWANAPTVPQSQYLEWYRLGLEVIDVSAFSGDLTIGVNPPPPRDYAIGDALPTVNRAQDIWSLYFAAYGVSAETQARMSGLTIKTVTDQEFARLFGDNTSVAAWMDTDHIGLTQGIVDRAMRSDPYVAEIIAHELSHYFWANDITQPMRDDFLNTVKQPQYADLAKEIFPKGDFSDDTMGNEAYAGFYARLTQLFALGLVSSEDIAVFGKFYPWVSSDYFTMALGSPQPITSQPTLPDIMQPIQTGQ